MQKRLPSPISKPLLLKGFTLIELLVVIAIIAVLSVIGFAIYSNLGAQAKARNITRRNDVGAIAKALEVNKLSTATNYSVLADTQFSNGKIPLLDPQGLAYCGNTDVSTQPADITGPSVGATCTPSGAGNYTQVGTAVPLAGTKWKICTWLEAEVNPVVAAKAFCKLSSQ